MEFNVLEFRMNYIEMGIDFILFSAQIYQQTHLIEISGIAWTF